MSQFDKDLKPGDIIRAYHAGIWRVTSIQRRFHEKAGGYYGNMCGDDGKLLPKGTEYNALIHYELVMDSTFRRPKGKPKVKCCDAACCERLDPEEIKAEMTAEIKKLRDGYTALLEVLNGK